MIRHEVAKKLVAKEQSALKKLIPDLDRMMQDLVRLNKDLDHTRE